MRNEATSLACVDGEALCTDIFYEVQLNNESGGGKGAMAKDVVRLKSTISTSESSFFIEDDVFVQLLYCCVLACHLDDNGEELYELFVIVVVIIPVSVPVAADDSDAFLVL